MIIGGDAWFYETQRSAVKKKPQRCPNCGDTIREDVVGLLSECECSGCGALLFIADGCEPYEVRKKRREG